MKIFIAIILGLFVIALFLLVDQLGSNHVRLLSRPDTVFIHDTIVVDTGTVMRLSREKLRVLRRWDEIEDSLKLLTRSYD